MIPASKYEGKQFFCSWQLLGTLICTCNCCHFFQPCLLFFFLVYFFFILYEFSVGIYFPSVAVCRSRYIPNEMRATITSMYRVPQNLFVILLLRYRSDLKRNQRLQLSSTALLSGAFIMLYLKRQMQRTHTVNKKKRE